MSFITAAISLGIAATFIGGNFMNRDSVLGEISGLTSEYVNFAATTETLTVHSAGFENGEPIPDKYSAYGEDLSPPLEWGHAPEGTRQWLLICEDPDAPRKEPFLHWIMTLPEDVRSLREGASKKDLPPGAREGQNDTKGIGYFGPKPPAGHGVHHYHFRLFALDRPIDFSAGSTRQKILDSIEGHIVGYGELIGTFEAPRGK